MTIISMLIQRNTGVISQRVELLKEEQLREVNACMQRAADPVRIAMLGSHSFMIIFDRNGHYFLHITDTRQLLIITCQE